MFLKNLMLISINLFLILLCKSTFILCDKNIKYIKNNLILYITLSLSCILYSFQLYFYFIKDSSFSVILLMSCKLIYSVLWIIKKQLVD